MLIASLEQRLELVIYRFQIKPASTGIIQFPLTFTHFSDTRPWLTLFLLDIKYYSIFSEVQTYCE